jgi:uncharacterized protein
MRFNRRARLDTGRVRDSGRGGSGRSAGGSSGMRIPIPGGATAGGGIGGVLVIVLFIVLTQCVGGGLGGSAGGGGGAGGGLFPTDQGGLGSETSRMEDSERYANCRTGEDANNDVDCARVAVENSLYRYWSQALPQQTGARFQPALVQTFSGGVSTGCGRASSQVGPFYCPADQGIYVDTTFFEDVLQGRLGGQGGDFVEPYVLAHEYGHHVQNLLGTMGRVRSQQGPQSDAVRLELQADCYAGMWTRAAEGTTDTAGAQIFADLDQGDIEEALDSARAVGDDRIQQRSGGRVHPEQWTHGSSEQRMRWFMTGYEQGTVEACDTFGATAL